MIRILGIFLLLLINHNGFCWGFYGHRKINEVAVFLLPPEMLILFKPNAAFIIEHSVDPDKRRYILPIEAGRHYIDIDHYGKYPFDSLPRNWNQAIAKYGADSLNSYGIVPWWIPRMLNQLTEAFRKKDQYKILKYAAELGHYIADAHVPLHATRNHNGQYTNQRGIHAFWESRIPELFAEKEWDFFIGKASYIKNPSTFTWTTVLQSALAVDSVLSFEKSLSIKFPSDQKFSFEYRNNLLLRQYSTSYCRAYDNMLDGMIERRMRLAIYAVASFWYTAWVNAGQPDLSKLVNQQMSPDDQAEFDALNAAWRANNSVEKDH